MVDQVADHRVDPPPPLVGRLMLAPLMNLDFAGSDSGVVLATKASLMLLGVGLLRLLAVL